MRRSMLIEWVLAAAVTAAGVIPIPSPAQQPPPPPYKVTPLVSAPLTADPSKETVVVRVDWPANVSTPWHTHPGDEYATVLEGSLITQREGEEAKTVLGGQSYHHPAGVVHVAKTGDQPATTINVFVVEKGKPFLAPVKK
jgi:quercetin dioxygenase-like cupin family protein